MSASGDGFASIRGLLRWPEQYNLKKGVLGLRVGYLEDKVGRLAFDARDY